MSQSNLRFVVMQETHFGVEPAAAFRDEGAAAAFIDSLSAIQRKSHWLERDGQVIENVRYREKRSSTYGHAWAVLERVQEAERTKLAERGYHFVDTGKVSNA